MAKRFGIMLDVSRNAVMKPEKVKEYTKIIKDFGYNMLMLYTEDTYEVDGEPYFGYLRGRYTKEDIKGIVEYSNSIGVEVIPCIQTLAHLDQIFKWHEYANINDKSNVLLVGEERTYTLIENMFKTVRECYTTDVIHIGMDEAHALGLGKYLAKHGFRNRFDILREHLERVIELAKKYGLKPLMWSDMFFRLANGGGDYFDYESINDEAISAKPEGVDLMFWDYYHNDKPTYDNMLSAHAKFSGETWFAGGVWTWFGPAPFNTFASDAMEKAICSAKEQDVDNIMMTAWCDDGHECSFYSVLPTLFKLRKIYDGVYDMDEIRREFREITGEDFDAMMALELPNMIAGNNPHSPSNPSKVMLYSDPLFGFIDVTVKDGVAPECRAISKKLREYGATSKKYGYLFEYMASLSDVIEIKYDLGKRARDAYKAGDRAALIALLPDFDVCATRVKKFHRAFSIVWHKENRPHGFEIHDMRLGGVIMRLESAMKRIKSYLAGGIDKLEELEEELLPLESRDNFEAVINRTPGTEGVPSFCFWDAYVSVNKLSSTR